MTAPARRGRALPVWRAFTVGGLAVVALYAAVLVAMPGTALATLVRDVGLGPVAVAGLAAMVVGILAHRPPRARAWWLLVAGVTTWVLAEVAIAISGDRQSTAANVLHLLGYPLLVLGVRDIVRARVPRRDLAGTVDALTVAAGLGLVGYALLVEPALRSDDLATQDMLVLLAYLVGDIVLFAGFVRIATSPGARETSTHLLLATLALLVVGDVALLVPAVYGTAVPAWTDIAFALCFVLVGSATLHPSMTGITRPGVELRDAVGTARLMLAGAASMVPPAVLVLQSVNHQAINVWAALVGSGVLVGLVLTRLRLGVDAIRTAGTRAQELQDQLTYEATHDALTALPNRLHGLKLLDQALERSREHGTTVTVMFLDLDGFKLVNDTLGHRAGDQLLRRIGERLQRAVRGEDQAIRLGGDEFVVVMESLPDVRTAQQVARRLIQTISQPVHLGPQGTAKVGASIGITQARAGRGEASALLHEADLAAYRAKRSGKGRAELFDAAMREELLAQERVALELRSAIDHDELVLHYQPVVESLSGEVRGYEALVRWQHPTRGLLQPADFLPVAEGADLICDLDRWVLRRASAQLQTWVEDFGFDRLVMAVNLSPTSASRTRVVDDVRDALRASGLRPDRLVVELPERVLKDSERTVVHLRQLRELGVGVSITDFGAGVGGLARLSQLPVNVVKVSRSSLDLGTPLGDRLLQLIVQGAHAVGLNAVAEGVERDEQLAILRALDCEMVQGFHIARPMPAEEVVTYHVGQAADRFSGLLP